MKMMDLTNIDSPLLDEILEDIAEDGEITPEQERKLFGMQKDAAGIIAQAKRQKELEQRLESSKRWRDNQRAKEKVWERMIEVLKSQMPQAMLKHKIKSPLKDEYGVVSVSLIKPREGESRRLELNDIALEKPCSMSGCYTKEQVDESTIPASYFDPIIRYKPDAKRIRASLNQGLEVGFAALESDWSVRVTSPKPKG